MKKGIGISLLMAFVVSCSTNRMNSVNELAIHDIQGCGHISPFNGKEVKNIQGVVTHKVSNGFTMQSLITDDKFCSSEGIFIFTNQYASVMVGDLVSVSGLVTEFTSGVREDFNLSQTEIVHPVIDTIETNQVLPQPLVLDEMADIIPHEIIENDGMTEFDIDEDGLDYYESLESMLVEIDHGWAVSPKDEFNEFTVLPDSFVNVNILSKYGALLKTREDMNPEKIIVKLPSSDDQSINAGDRVDSPIIGVMDYSYGNYKLLSLKPLTFSRNKEVVASFTSIANGLSIASYNLENLSFFDNEKKFSSIAKQIVNSLDAPDLLILHEVMDDSGTVDDGEVSAKRTIEKLISEILKQDGPEYSYSDPTPLNDQDGGIEGGNIRSVLLYRTDKRIKIESPDPTIKEIVITNGRFSLQANPIQIGVSSASFANSRKPAVWLLNQYDKQFFVIGVHLTSQGADSPDWGSQQPPNKDADTQRIKEAVFIRDFSNRLLNLQRDIPVIIAGDMNDDPWSETINTLKGTNFFNTGELEDANEQYSYLFEGNAQQLDYLLFNKTLAGNVLQTRFIHLNTLLDLSKQISDHDPVIAEIILK